MKKMSKVEVKKIFWEVGIELNTKNNLSQIGGLKPMVEIGQTGKDPLVSQFITNVVEEAQFIYFNNRKAFLYETIRA